MSMSLPSPEQPQAQAQHQQQQQSPPQHDQLYHDAQLEIASSLCAQGRQYWTQGGGQDTKSAKSAMEAFQSAL